MKIENKEKLLSVNISNSEIDRIEIVQLNGLTMNEWYNKQTNKPNVMLNGSLWDEKGAIGTIWEKGKLVRNEGTGFGFGIISNNYDYGFEDPWNIKWHNYITGYPALIRNGKMLSDAVDSYVQNSSTKRSIIGTAGKNLYLITTNNMTIAQLRSALLNFGIYHAINLDGGGSSRLLINGEAINNPTDNRKCPNAIAIWLKNKNNNTNDTQGEKMNKFIAIDAGHGLNTAGKRCLKSLDPNETREWTLNSRIATYLDSHLKRCGFSTIRVDDMTGKTDVALSERTNKANNNNCDAYISIHHDSGVNGSQSGGATVFVYPKSSSTSKLLQQNIYNNFISEVGKFGNRSNPLNTADFHVLRETSMPAILIECGFMDSSIDVPLILSDSFARKASIGIAKGICKTFEVKYIEEKEDETMNEAEKEHWAQKFYDSLKLKGIEINETRFDDPITRGEIFVLLDQIVE